MCEMSSLFILVRRTRSGKIVRTPPAAKAVKAPMKRVRKKAAVIQMETSEEEEENNQLLNNETETVKEDSFDFTNIVEECVEDNLINEGNGGTMELLEGLQSEDTGDTNLQEQFVTEETLIDEDDVVLSRLVHDPSDEVDMQTSEVLCATSY